MNRQLCAAVVAVALTVSPRAGSAQWRPLKFERDTAYSLRALGFSRSALVLTGRDGRMLMAQEYLNGDVVAYDSTFKKLPLKLTIGRGLGAEIAYATQWGWVGDSLWLLDPYYRQVAILGRDGKLATSIGWPSWVRPFWADRRKYPLFANIRYWYAAYPDATLLVEPTAPRRLIDTPGYDPDQNVLVRIDGDGRILKTVARMPAMDGRLQLRSGTEKQFVSIPNYARSMWRVSTDGRRIAVVSPIASDSGAFRVTVLNENADTVFSRRYAIEASRIAAARIDTILIGQKAFGRYTVEQIRDTVRKLLPAFYSPIVNMDFGVDYSVWISVRRPSTKMEDAEHFVVDDKGEPRGIVTVTRQTKFVSRTVSQYWVIQQEKVMNKNLSPFMLVHFRLAGSKGALTSRSARAAASSRTVPPQE